MKLIISKKEPIHKFLKMLYNARYMRRAEMIKNVIQDLKNLLVAPNEQYALEATFEFLDATKSLTSYLRWLIFRAPKLDGKQLLELSDFNVAKWEQEVQQQLIIAERKRF